MLFNSIKEWLLTFHLKVVERIQQIGAELWEFKDFTFQKHIGIVLSDHKLLSVYILKVERRGLGIISMWLQL